MRSDDDDDVNDDEGRRGRLWEVWVVWRPPDPTSPRCLLFPLSSCVLGVFMLYVWYVLLNNL